MNINPMVRGITREIMQVLKITDENLALRVETEMSQNIRFSECSKARFRREARFALDVIRYVDAHPVPAIPGALNASKAE